VISGTANAASAGIFTLGDLTVNRLGFGAMRLSGTGGMGQGVDRDPAASRDVVRHAVELGVNHIDTAAFYFSGSAAANAVIRDALAPYPDDVVIATKVGPRRTVEDGWADWAGPEDLRSDVERNLTELGLDHLALVSYRSNGRDDVAAAVAALAELRADGLLRHIGLSNVDLDRLEQARAVTDIVSVQNRHAPGYARSDTSDVMGACGAAGIAFVPFFTIAGRAREDTAQEQYDVVRAIADAHRASPAQVRIAWTLALGPHVLAIPGTGDLAHLEANVAAAGLTLTVDDLAALDVLS
jgi:pyridoxine 4-dehydrogenase